jgi:hypothetical protein
VERIADLVGNDVLSVEDAGNGWPALGTLLVDGVSTPVALYAAPVGLSHRGRDDVERRFQNPGPDRPILSGRHLLLLGLWEADEFVAVDRPLLVSADPIRRVGHTTRFSVFVSMNTLRVALHTGWAEDTTTSGETIRSFVPPLLPVSFAADRDDAAPLTTAMEAAIVGSGLLGATEPEVAAASERARRAASTLVRDARFSRRVISAYAGLCAMCGLDADLVEGSHIYPVSAPGSHDEPWNGLALCPNHHAAFDKHVVAVRPESREIVFHDSILEMARSNPALGALVEGTFTHLSEPADRNSQPRSEMFNKRYEHYFERYAWVV